MDNRHKIQTTNQSLVNELQWCCGFHGTVEKEAVSNLRLERGNCRMNHKSIYPVYALLLDD